MSKECPGFRIFVLGAGFSKPAGLPLASDLFSLSKSAIESRFGTETVFQKDVDRYIKYRNVCDDINLDETNLDIEELISFWDIEHFLWLKGKDTWSDEGNESQLMIRKAIGEVIQSRTPASNQLPDVYYRFADSLTTNDTVITFNYDVILERALDHIGKPYRLFPYRNKSISKYSSIIDNDKDEIVILKLHGSVDWFSNKQFLEQKKSLAEQGLEKSNLHSVFDETNRYGAEQLVDGLRPPDDSLQNIFRIHDVDNYYRFDDGFIAPFLLSPSYVKFLYAPPIVDFWHGLNQSGGWNLGISVIGFSLPNHDEYIRQVLYNIITNYQEFYWDDNYAGNKKNRVKFVDYRENQSSIDEYKMRYRFSDPEKSEFWFNGFNEDAISFIF